MPNRTEDKTRKELIDPQLDIAGWDVKDPAQVGIEIPTDGFDPESWKKLKSEITKISDKGGSYDAKLPEGICDYTLHRENGQFLAIVEAKRTSVDPRLAQAQTQFYIEQIEKLPNQDFRPFGFMANGRDIYFWDVGRENKREIHGFFSRLDLETLLYIRQNKKPLTEAIIKPEITDRVYQQEAIRRACEAFEGGKRKALLTMATGTGKTRVAMSLVDVFQRSNQAQQILFVADRTALVQQALDEGFKTCIPNEPATRIYTHNIDTTSRLYVVTLQTLNNCFQEFTPAFFDLIIFDEVHRSIFNKWNEVLQYFDGRMIGLTATPAEFIDRNTFLEFDCTDGIPTFLYSYEQAIEEGYLVDYDLYVAQTKFQRKGIRGVDLTEEERNALVEQGIDPDSIDYAGTDIEKKVSNKDTLRKQWEEFWDVCLKDQSGQLPGKTIVFAMTQDHAVRLADVFEEMYPQYPGLAQVITYKSEYKGSLIKRFKKEDKPRIAISVDMLETGVNIPEVVNLVFMRPIQSRIKLDQMVGRGTRTHETCRQLHLLPNGHKESFLIMDFWENDFKKAPETEIAQSLPVLVTIFNTRLKLLEVFQEDQNKGQAERTIRDLRKMIDLIPLDSFSVKRSIPIIEPVFEDDYWRLITQAKLEFLKNQVGPLLRYAPAVDVQAMTFISKVERLKLQIVTNKDPAATALSIAEDVDRLPKFVFEDEACKEPAALCISPALKTATPEELNQIINTLASQMKNRRKLESPLLKLDLQDLIESRGWIILQEREDPVYFEEYRRLVNQRVLDIVAEHPTIEAIERGDPVSDQQLLELERTLRIELGSGDLELSEENIRKAYRMNVDSFLGFLRELLELDWLPGYKEIVKRQFSEYISRNVYNASQTQFIRVVQSVFLQKRRLINADLYDPPLDTFGIDAVERLFAPDQIQELLTFTESLVVVRE